MPASLEHQERVDARAANATVWKFEWPSAFFSGVAEINMPRGAEVIHAAEQFGKIQLWARVDPAALIEPKRFALCLTGAPAPTILDGRFIATLILNGGSFVVHIFEQT